MSGQLKVFVAEKPKLGRAIATVLAMRSPAVESDREFIRGRDWVVCWSSGHAYDMVEPDYYIAKSHPDARKTGDGKRFSWSFDHLPLLPAAHDWPLRPDPSKRGLLSTIKKFVGQATVVVNAGDPDREGQLLIDEILEQMRVNKPVRRVLISGFDEATVRRGLDDERDNRDFAGMRDAARARSRADWLAGMNYSRAVTLQAQSTNGRKGVLSIGRVQTPVLGLIVQRDNEIANFKPVDYFGLTASIAVQAGVFKAQWQPREGQVGLDAQGRLLDQRVAQDLRARVANQAGRIESYSDERKKENAPLPFSVDKIQILASRKFGYRSDAVLAALQSLYETHQLTTYPRSDCQYLPTSQHGEARQVLGSVKHALGLPEQVSQGIDSARKSAAWNDGKVTAHHAIIPTSVRANLDSLSKIERDIYLEICKRYAAQFMPPREYRAVNAQVEVKGERFKATGSTTIIAGWKALYGSEDADDEKAETVLPPMKQGEDALCKGLDVESKRTEPPRHFTDDTLLEAMVNIHKFVTNEKVQAVFKRMLADKNAGNEEAPCGIGTPATRHTFVPKLEAIGVVETRKGKGKAVNIVSTEAGRALVAALPRELTTPDMTALWESVFQNIEAGKNTVDQFMEVQGQWITRTIENIKATALDIPAFERKAVQSSFGGGGRGGGASRAYSGGKARSGSTAGRRR